MEQTQDYVANGDERNLRAPTCVSGCTPRDGWQCKHKHTCSGHTWRAGRVLLKIIITNKRSLRWELGGGQKENTECCGPTALSSCCV